MDKNNSVPLSAGDGGAMSHRLVRDVFLKHFKNKTLNLLEDSAELSLSSSRVAFTTDGFVVNPIEFAGGDIGKLAVCGTVNDLAVKGAVNGYLSASFIIEEGLGTEILERIVKSMQSACDEAGFEIAAGDTKVVEKGKADKIFITTAGIGAVREAVNLAPSRVREGAAIIVSGNLAEHGVTVLNARHNLAIQGDIKSDCAPLNKMISAVLDVCPSVYAMRDLTRGGFAGALNEICQTAKCDMEIDENLIPVSPAVKSACGILGLDPLYMANEGKIVVITSAETADAVLQSIRKNNYGKNACIVGRVLNGNGRTILKTTIGASRVVRMYEGAPMPRIC